MYEMSKPEQKKYIIIALVAAFVLLIITTIIIANMNRNKSMRPGADTPATTSVDQPTPATTSINKLDELAENLPDNRIILVESNLFETIKLNAPGGQAIDITDAVIRENSYRQTLNDTARQIFFTTFIVDVPSLRQSYRVNDYYSPLPAKESGLYDYATLVLCPTNEELIYETFPCIDRIKYEQGVR